MTIKFYKPTTNGRRNMTALTYEEITTSTPEKSLLVTVKKHAGRNNLGRITVRHHGGGDWRAVGPARYCEDRGCGKTADQG